MAKYYFEFNEAVAIANGKSPDPTELLEKMKLRGKVTPFEEVEAAIRAESQATIDDLVAQHQAIADQELTDDEIVWLSFIRERKAIETDGFMKQIAARDKVIEDVRADSQKRAEQLALFADQLREMAT
jgi:hypothetical protein